MEPVEDRIPDQFLPLSPRHAIHDFIQPEIDLSPHFLDNSTPQQAANFHWVDIRNSSSQQLTDDLEYIENEIRTVLEDLQLSLVVNTSASCNAAAHDESEGSDDDDSSCADIMCDSECDSDAEAHTDTPLDNDCSTGTGREVTSHLDVQTPLKPCSGNLICLENELCSKETPKHNNSMCEETQSNEHEVSENPAADSQSFCAQQHPSTANCHLQPDDIQVSRQSSESKAHHPGRKTSRGKVKKMSRAKNWQVQNVSKRCSLFEYKEEILNQQIPVHRRCVLQKVSLVFFWLHKIWFIIV